MFSFFKKKQLANETENNVVKLASADLALQKYKQQAQDEISYLIQFMASHQRDEELYKYVVKTAFTQNENVEHMWVQVDEFEAGFFKGRLVNEPNTINYIKYGEETLVNRHDVEDWILVDCVTNTQVGGFSTNYLSSEK